MEYSKDEVYHVRYDNKMLIEEERTGSVISAIKKNNIIKLIIGITVVLSIANFICIYNFFSILSNI